MVGHFVRLKLRLLANRLKTESILGTIGFVLVWMAAVFGGVLGGLAVFGLGRLTDDPAMVLVLAYTVVFAGWMVIPAAFSAVDDTLDPRRFELLPIAPRQLISGLLVAGGVAPGALGTLIGLVVATVASYPMWSLAPVLALAVMVELLLCLVIARLVTTVLSNLLASRRARELVTLAFALVFALVALLPVLLDSSGGDGEPQIEITLTSLEVFGVLAWFPPGALARAVSLAAGGSRLIGMALAVYGVLATVVIGWAWARSVRRMLVHVPTTGRTGSRHEDSGRTLALTPDWLRLRPGPVAGMVAKELRYIVRDNRVRAQLLGTAIPLVVVMVLLPGAIADGPYAPFLAVVFAFLMVFGALSNQFGVDGGSFWGYVVSPAPLAEIVKGKNLGWGIVVFSPAFVVALGLGMFSGELAYVAAAVVASLAVLFVAMAIGNITSIYGAFRVPESNPFGNRSFSGSVFIAVILSMVASGALLLPIAALVALPAVFLGPLATTVGAVLGVGYGIILYRLLMHLTSRLLVERRQALIDVIDGEKD